MNIEKEKISQKIAELKKRLAYVEEAHLSDLHRMRSEAGVGGGSDGWRSLDDDGSYDLENHEAEEIREEIRRLENLL